MRVGFYCCLSYPYLQFSLCLKKRINFKFYGSRHKFWSEFIFRPLEITNWNFRQIYFMFHSKKIPGSGDRRLRSNFETFGPTLNSGKRSLIFTENFNVTCHLLHRKTIGQVRPKISIYRVAENIAFERKQIWKQLAICDCGILIKVKAFSDVSFWQTNWVHKVWRLFMLM